jgi:hypothetical protein
MGGMRDRPFARKARPVQCERDYISARQVLSDGAKCRLTCEEEERLEALLRELICYESEPCRTGSEPSNCLVANGGPGPSAAGEGPSRRWSDMRVETAGTSSTNGAFPCLKATVRNH